MRTDGRRDVGATTSGATTYAPARRPVVTLPTVGEGGSLDAERCAGFMPRRWWASSKHLKPPLGKTGRKRCSTSSTVCVLPCCRGIAVRGAVAARDLLALAGEISVLVAGSDNRVQCGRLRVAILAVASGSPPAGRRVTAPDPHWSPKAEALGHGRTIGGSSSAPIGRCTMAAGCGRWAEHAGRGSPLPPPGTRATAAGTDRARIPC